VLTKDSVSPTISLPDDLGGKYRFSKSRTDGPSEYLTASSAHDAVGACDCNRAHSR